MAKKRKYTIEYVTELLSKEGYTVLSEKEYNEGGRLLVRCPAGHENRIYISYWVRGNRCLDCSGSRKYTIETVRNYVESQGYGLNSKEYIRAGHPLDLKCPEGHVYTASWSKFKGRGDRCPFCSGHRGPTQEEVEKLFIENNLEYTGHEGNMSQNPIYFKCEVGHEHAILISNLRKGQSCGICYKNSNTPKVEHELRGVFSSYGTEVIFNDRSVIEPFELDFLFEKERVAIEYCGLYWHSDTVKTSRKYHYNKMILCREKGIRLITVFEDEYIEKPDVVLSRIRNALGISNRRVYARKCSVSLIGNKVGRDFLKKYHLQGASPAKFYIGIFNGDELVGVMSGGCLTRKHVTSKKSVELKRLAFLPGTSVVGGASKMFKVFIYEAKKLDADEIRSYCDMRYGNYENDVYTKLGLRLAYESKYTPHYIKHQKRYRNYSLRKTPEERESGKTEYELRAAQGYHRIWDCGHRTYIKDI